jgi:hypothetical protein
MPKKDAKPEAKPSAKPSDKAAPKAKVINTDNSIISNALRKVADTIDPNVGLSTTQIASALRAIADKIDG